MRIACLTGTWPSPSETFIAREVESLRACGLDIEVFSLWGPEHRLSWAGVLGQLRHPFANCRWQFALLGALRREGRRALQAFWNLGAGFDLARHVERTGVDRVHAHFASLPSTLGWVAAQVARVPFSFSVHARDVFVEPQFLAAKARAADHILACSSAAAERVRELIDPGDGSKVALIHHGLPLDRFPFASRPLGAPAEVLAVGRFVPKKGLRHLIQAVRILRGRGVPVTCRLVGDGPERPALESEAADLGDAVGFPGWLLPNAVRAAYAHAALIAVPSVVDAEGDRDGLPNVALEAAALGVPIVTTDTGGLPDLIQHGDTGLVAPAGDAEALAECIEAVLGDPSGAAERARRARALVEAEFDSAQQAAKLAALLGR